MQIEIAPSALINEDVSLDVLSCLTGCYIGIVTRDGSWSARGLLVDVRLDDDSDKRWLIVNTEPGVDEWFLVSNVKSVTVI